MLMKPPPFEPVRAWIRAGYQTTRLDDHDANRTVACGCGGRDWRLVRVGGQALGLCGACGSVTRLRKKP
jgi:hypothetical protein